MTSLAGKTFFITGASRGIALAIALRAAHRIESNPQMSFGQAGFRVARTLP